MTSIRRHLAPLLLGVVAAAAALLITPTTSAETPLGRLDVSVRPGTRGTQLEIPPLGSVRAATHPGPLEVRIELGRLELDRVPAATGTEEAREETVSSAEESLHRALVRHLLLAAAIATVLAMLLVGFRRPGHRRPLLGAATGAVLSLAAAAAWTMAVFDPGAFAAPTFQGPLSEAPEVMKKLDSALENVGNLKNRLDAVTEQLELLTGPVETPQEQFVLLHVSDLHSNAVGVAWVNELTERFAPDVVVDTGDVTSFGVTEEAGVIERFLTVAKENYLVVFGNHDSVETRERLAGRLTSIDRELVERKGITILGMDDPTYTVKEGSTSSDDPKYRLSGEELRALCEKHRPTVVAVHNPEQARYVDGCAGVVIAGHRHQAEQYREPRGTLVSVAGTTGASGIEGLNPDGRYYAEILRFDTEGLRSIDVIAMNPTSGEIEIRRVNPRRIPPGGRGATP